MHSALEGVARVAQALDDALPAVQGAVQQLESRTVDAVLASGKGASQPLVNLYTEVVQECRRAEATSAMFQEVLASTLWSKVHAFAMDAHAGHLRAIEERLDTVVCLQQQGTPCHLPRPCGRLLADGRGRGLVGAAAH